MELLGSLWELQGALSELLGQLLEFLGSLLGAILAQRARLEAIFARAGSIGNNFHWSGLDWERFSLERARLGAIFAPAGSIGSNFRSSGLILMKSGIRNIDIKLEASLKQVLPTGSEFEAGASNWKRV